MIIFRSLRFLAPALLAAGVCASPGAHAGAPDTLPVTQVTRAQMQPFAALLNELSERRRRVVYTPGGGSLYDGAAAGLVRLGAGNLSLRRLDLFADDPLPIEAARVYDSRRREDGDLGRGGWAFGLAERLEIDGDYARLILAGGRSVALRADGDAWRPRRAEPGVPARVVEAAARWRTAAPDGTITDYAPHADATAFEIALRRDRFGNTLHFDYGPGDRLLAVRSASQTVTIERDAQGRVVQVGDAHGRRVSYAYDAAGFLVRATDAAGNDWHYDYDADGRLRRAVAPGGEIDLDVRYDARGRVSRLRRHASVSDFDYGSTDTAAPGLEVTRLRVAGRGDRHFGHDARGATVWARADGFGTTRIALDDAGRAVSLYADGVLTQRLDYDAHGRPARIDASGAGARYFDWAPQGLAAIRTGDGQRLVSVERGAGGRVEVTAGGVARWYALDARGVPVAVGYGAGRDYALESDAQGRVVRVVDALGQALGLAWSATGTLEAATFPGGERHLYGYDAAGLRVSATRDAALALRYHYAPSGRIHRYEATGPDGVRAVTQHRFDANQRLVAVEGEEGAVTIEYGPDERARRIDGGALALRFHYDALGRLSAVDDGREAWRYAYGPGEADLVLGAERRHGAVPLAFGPADLAGLYARRFARGARDVSGPVRLDVDVGRFVLDGPYGVALPGAALREALQAMGLIAAGGEALAGSGDGAALKAFESPSNLVFVPPEYWALNCIICFGGHPHSLIGQRDARAGLGATAAQLQQICDVDIDVQPDCTLEVSGLPPYLCDRAQARIGADLTPVDLPRQFIDWVTNDQLVTVPIGVSGSPILVRGVWDGGGVPDPIGTVTARYSRQGLTCTASADVPVIVNDPLDFDQVTDTDLCPERQQDTTRLREIDGCSIAGVVADWFFSGDPNDPVDGTFNVPGTSTRFGAPQDPLPWGQAPLPLPCNVHDVCYQSCGHHRLGCDSAFLQDLGSVCDTAYPSDCPYSLLSPACVQFELEKVECALRSTELHQIVRGFGEPSYRQRQVQYCDCCPS